MWSRLRLDIGWSDLGYAAWRSVSPPDAARAERAAEAAWPAEGGLACLSVRTGFDLTLQALALPEGSEILFSAINIQGMLRVANRLGLAAVPVDIDLQLAAPRLDLLERAITPRTRAIVVAHLFGTRLDLDGVIAVAKKHGLVVLEDCAQAYVGPDYVGHPQADVSMFSFGPLKTSTALGGAMLTVRNPELRAKMRALQASYPEQRRGEYLSRVLKFAGLKIILSRPVFGLVFKLLQMRGAEFDTTIGDAVRNVAKLSSSKKLRKRPSAAMLAVMARRLRHFSAAHLAARTHAGERLRALLGDALPVPAAASRTHSYWVFPVLVDDPKAVMPALRAAGFDATNLPRSAAAAAPEDRPELDPKTATHVMQHLMVLPCYPLIPESALRRQAEVLKRVAGTRAAPTEAGAPAKPQPHPA
jgi:dTDP-4-amino-4,6-dideoxygalactose transaminase